jgi:YggT family protein
MMSNYQPTQDVEVDRREETVITRQPGYAATEQVTRDIAAERRQLLFLINRIIWSLAGLLEVLLLIRFGLKLIGANPHSVFAVFIYGLTGVFTVPFTDLIPTVFSGENILELTTAIAMVIYALLFWGIVSAIPLITDRPHARTVRRSTRDETSGDPGNVHTTHTISGP